MKNQLVATIVTSLTSSPLRKNGDKRPKYPVTRTVVYHIKFWHNSFLRCGCSPGVDIVYAADATDIPEYPACSHIQALYVCAKTVDRTFLSPLGHEMFEWRWVAHALKENR